MRSDSTLLKNIVFWGQHCKQNGLQLVMWAIHFQSIGTDRKAFKICFGIWWRKTRFQLIFPPEGWNGLGESRVEWLSQQNCKVVNPSQCIHVPFSNALKSPSPRLVRSTICFNWEWVCTLLFCAKSTSKKGNYLLRKHCKHNSCKPLDKNVPVG